MNACLSSSRGLERMHGRDLKLFLFVTGRAGLVRGLVKVRLDVVQFLIVNSCLSSGRCGLELGLEANAWSVEI